MWTSSREVGRVPGDKDESECGTYREKQGHVGPLDAVGMATS